jgi:hypothetical protein
LSPINSCVLSNSSLAQGNIVLTTVVVSKFF